MTNDLATDQRVAKTCSALLDMGYEIILIGRELKNSLPINRTYATKRLRLVFNHGFLFYAEYSVRLFFVLLFSKKDILFANDLDTLTPNYLVSKLQKKKLVFDSHELFSEIPELVDRPFIKNFWNRLEQWMIPNLKNIITVSKGIQQHYLEHYQVSSTIIRNVPICSDNISTEPFGVPKSKKVILYQGSLNVGRGLDLMIDTMSLLDDYILVIIGDGDIIEDLEKKVLDQKLENKVLFLGKVSPDALKKLTPNAYIGISLEEDLGLNYRYALPNKLFDYIQAKVPVIVSDVQEMKALVNEYNIGEILHKRTPEELAITVHSIQKEAYSEALEAAKKQLTWSNEKIKLLDFFKQLG